MTDLYNIGIWISESYGASVYEFNPKNDIVGNVVISQGIKGNGPLDRVAPTGTCSMYLYNPDGRYTPGHSNCNVGFGVGSVLGVRAYSTAVSLSSVIFYGVINNIEPVKSAGLGMLTKITAVDFINQLALQTVGELAFDENQRYNDVAQTIIESLPYYPPSRTYFYGTSIFPTAFDTSLAGTRALSEISKAAISELGFLVCRPYLTDNISSFGRHTTFPDATYGSFTDEDIIDAGFSYGKNYYNDVKTTVYPRSVDAAATSVLYSLNYPLQIEPGETITLKGAYKDPNQEAVSVTGRDMVTPVSTTDYTFNTKSDGSGLDITADLDVTATYSVNSVEYELTNNNASIGYVTLLQARGKGIYIYRPVEYHAEDSALIAADGRITLDLSLPYQDDPNVGVDFATALLDIYKVKTFYPEWFELDINANLNNVNFFCLDPLFSMISLDLSDVEINTNFLVTGRDITIETSGHIVARYYITPEAYLPSGNFWQLNSATKSQLDSTTILAF